MGSDRSLGKAQPRELGKACSGFREEAIAKEGKKQVQQPRGLWEQPLCLASTPQHPPSAVCAQTRSRAAGTGKMPSLAPSWPLGRACSLLPLRAGLASAVAGSADCQHQPQPRCLLLRSWQTRDEAAADCLGYVVVQRKLQARRVVLASVCS